MAAIDGLGSGLDTSAIITQLMQIERLPQNRLANKRLGALAQGTAWEGIGNALKALQTASFKISQPGALTGTGPTPFIAGTPATAGTPYEAARTTSSAANLLTATAGPGAVTANHTLRVTQLAAAQQLSSSTTFASAATAVGAGALLLVKAPELAGLAAGYTGAVATSAATGAVTLDVTQASAAAKLSGTAAAAASTTLTGGGGGNNRLNLTINGTARAVTIAAGTYTQAQLATAIQNGLNAAGATGITVTNNAGVMEFTTTRQGSAATISVQAGTANTALRLPAAGTVATGTNAIVNVNGAATTITQVEAATNQVLGGITLSGVTGFKLGTTTMSVARTAAGATVTDLAAAVTASGGATGAVVSDGAGGFKLQISGTTTGAAPALQVLQTGMTPADIGFTTTRTAADAQFTLDGVAQTSKTNTVDGLITGVSLTLVAPGGATDVTLSVTAEKAAVAGTPSTPDQAATAGTAGTAAAGTTAAGLGKDLVTALNAALGTLITATAVDPTTRAKGVLVGNSQARTLTNDLRDAVTVAGTGTAATLGGIGIKLERNGTYTFDEAAFAKALKDDPANTQALIGRLTTGLTDLAKRATTNTPATGTTEGALAIISQGKQSSTDRAASLQKMVEAYDKRLEATETRLRRQFTQLDTALSSLRSQGSWLSGQLRNL